MLPRSPLSRLIRWVPIAVLLGPSQGSFSQGTTDHLPGKNYLIRVSPFANERSEIATIHLPAFLSLVERSGGMADHIPERVRAMQHVDGRWFLAYFNPERQQQESLLQDHDLLHWLCNGRDVQIIPIELTRSP